MKPLIIKKSDIVEALKDLLEREPTLAEIDSFAKYLVKDVGTWLNENVDANCGICHRHDPYLRFYHLGRLWIELIYTSQLL